MRYVIGADCGSTKCLIKAKDFEGNLLATSMGKTTNHLLIGLNEAKRRIVKQVNDLIASFNGKKEDCACIVVGAAGVPFPVSWTVKMKKKQKETQDILSYHTQAAGCSDKARAKASGGRQPIEECGRTGL